MRLNRFYFSIVDLFNSKFAYVVVSTIFRYDNDFWYEVVCLMYWCDKKKWFELFRYTDFAMAKTKTKETIQLRESKQHLKLKNCPKTYESKKKLTNSETKAQQQQRKLICRIKWCANTNGFCAFLCVWLNVWCYYCFLYLMHYVATFLFRRVFFFHLIFCIQNVFRKKIRKLLFRLQKVAKDTLCTIYVI